MGKSFIGETIPGIKKRFLDKQIRCGAYYELCIQVSNCKEVEPINQYLDAFWNMDFIGGPFNESFDRVAINNGFERNEGIAKIGNQLVPFILFPVFDEESIAGYNWFYIGIYTATIDEIFGLEYSARQEYPPQVTDFYTSVLKRLHKIHPFQLAYIDFDVSQEFVLDDLKNDFDHWSTTKFYVGKENISAISDSNKRILTVID